MPSSDTEAGAEGDEEQVVAAVDPHHAIGDGSAWLLMANHTAMATLAPPTPRGGWQLRGASSPGWKICVFDLDNTLVVARYGLFDSPPRDDELDLPGSPLPYPQQGTSPMRVQARPGAIELLKLMHATCDVVLWTTSERKVALPKVEWLEDRVRAAPLAHHLREALPDLSASSRRMVAGGPSLCRHSLPLSNDTDQRHVHQGPQSLRLAAW